MACNERSPLLGNVKDEHQHPQHIVVVPSRKDSADYEPIFTTADYSDSLTLEELLPYQLDPWWQKARHLSFAFFVLTFLLTLLAALLLAFLHNDTACRISTPITTNNATMSMMRTTTMTTLVGNGTLLLAGI